MRLKASTTYRDGNNRSVHIAGPTGKKFDGKDCWWSIEGDHYTEDGLMLQSKRAVPPELGLVKFTTDDHPGNILSEDTSEGARKWWEGVS